MYRTQTAFADLFIGISSPSAFCSVPFFVNFLFVSKLTVEWNCTRQFVDVSDHFFIIQCFDAVDWATERAYGCAGGLLNWGTRWP